MGDYWMSVEHCGDQHWGDRNSAGWGALVKLTARQRPQNNNARGELSYLQWTFLKVDFVATISHYILSQVLHALLSRPGGSKFLSSKLTAVVSNFQD
jgi:hypothetical protein